MKRSMISHLHRILSACLLVGLVLGLGGRPVPSAAGSTSIKFDDSDPNLIKLSNSYYEIGFLKVNGSISEIIDRSTGSSLSPGSRYGCLWGGVFINGGKEEFTGGCGYETGSGNTFSYAYNAQTARLTFTYTAGAQAARRVDAVVVIQAREDHAFDLQLTVKNHSTQVMDRALFPCDLVFYKSEIQEALLPVMPGVVLEQSLFYSADFNGRYQFQYPGWPGVFASYTGVNTTKGRLALYDLFDPAGYLRETWLGFWNDTENPPYKPDSTVLTHVFGARQPGGQDWTSPWVRVQVGLSFLQSIQAYRAENQLDLFPSLQTKLGGRYDQVVQSPLYKIDAAQVPGEIPFTKYDAQVLAKVPVPGILHPVAYTQRGFDENYPDFLPPDSKWGTTEDMAAMFRAAQKRGFLVMPYTNPTWWDDESPTLRNLPAGTTIQDIAVIDENGKPVYENYGAHWGYVVSPHAPFVQTRLAKMIKDMTTLVPSDMLFEDQVGARAWLYDFNRYSPDPMSYMDGWMDHHTELYQAKLLHTEMGYDRLAESEVGFHGSVLLPLRQNDPAWMASGWHFYPLATMLARDKVLFYQHDLAPETFTHSKETLAWNMAYGFQLSYNLVNDNGGGLDSPWLQVVGVFQKYALSLYASEPVTNFESLGAGVTRTTFQSCVVTANGSASQPYTTGGYSLPTQGAMVDCPDGRLTAGVFTSFNGQALSAGEHYLVVHRRPGNATIWQPMGSDTDITLGSLPYWKPGDLPTAAAFTLDGKYIQNVPLTVVGQAVRFTYHSTLGGQAVGSIRVHWPANDRFLALILR